MHDAFMQDYLAQAERHIAIAQDRIARQKRSLTSWFSGERRPIAPHRCFMHWRSACTPSSSIAERSSIGATTDGPVGDGLVGRPQPWRSSSSLSQTRDYRAVARTAKRLDGSRSPGSPDVVPEPAMATATAVRRATPMDELFAIASRTIDRVFICFKTGYRQFGPSIFKRRQHGALDLAENHVLFRCQATLRHF